MYVWAATLNYWTLFFFLVLYGMSLLENSKIAETFLSIGWNTLWLCAELLLHPKSLDNWLTLQSHVKVIFQNNFQVGLDKIFQSKCIWLDAKHGTVSSKWACFYMKPFRWYEKFAVRRMPLMFTIPRRN